MKQQLQSFGRTLSAMVMPNIGAFIAWGLITAIFIPGGWWPNEHIAEMVAPTLKYLLPLLIAYTAGKNVAGVRGGVAGAVAAMGVIVGTDTPMFLGAMIMGPIAGWCIKKFDKLVEGKIHSGLEMLVDNFSLGIIAMLLAIVGFLLIGNAVSAITLVLSKGVNWMLHHNLNPLLSLIVDPAKVVFLNNAVNHGIMTPLGIQQASEVGQSMLFLVDPNPGPGLGILLACWVFGKGTTKQSAPGAILIEFIGGIHEVYFPYVLSRPVLILPIIAGNICSLLFFTLTDFGLVAPASPGSIISIILMSPRGKTLIGILGVIIGTAVSFLIALPFIRKNPDFQADNDSAGGSVIPGISAESTKGAIKVVFACDAGMGSSALGASRFRERLAKEGLGNILCTNSAVEAIPQDASIVVCQKELSERAGKVVPGKSIVIIKNFLNDPALEGLIATLKSGSENTASQAQEISPEQQLLAAEKTLIAKLQEDKKQPPMVALLKPENIKTGLASEDKESAIRRAGRLLFESGYVDEAYIEAMIERERFTTTYMGLGLAIPHGTSEAKENVKASGICVLQYPEGVDFGEEKARLIVGIAGVGNEHLEILARLGETLEDSETLEALCTTSNPETILEILERD